MRARYQSRNPLEKGVTRRSPSSLGSPRRHPRGSDSDPIRTILYVLLSFERWMTSAIRRLDLESRGDREEHFVRPDAGHELDGTRQPVAIEAPRQREGGCPG
jgi:hypothetical protein